MRLLISISMLEEPLPLLRWGSSWHFDRWRDLPDTRQNPLIHLRNLIGCKDTILETDKIPARNPICLINALSTHCRTRVAGVGTGVYSRIIGIALIIDKFLRLSQKERQH